MIARHDLAIGRLGWIEVPKKNSGLIGILPLQVELLIKIAIVDFALPSHAEGVAAHESINRRRVERVDQQIHVLVKFVIVPQISGKAPDREVRDRIELVEDDPEMGG